MSNRKAPTIAIIGTGRLGRACQAVFKSAAILASADLDIRSYTSITSVLNPTYDVIINTAAYTAVDDCETNQDIAYSVNAVGPTYLAQWCQVNQATLIHLSTDYVFDGLKSGLYTESDQTVPLNYYGYSKLKGEAGVLNNCDKAYIFRIQWLYGPGNTPDFIRTIRKIAKNQTIVSVVNDQWGSPTAASDIAIALQSVITSQLAYGIYHMVAQSYTTWYDLACLCLESYQGVSIQPVSSETYKRPAKRPLNTKLDTSKLSRHAIQLPDWRESVRNYIVTI